MKTAMDIVTQNKDRYIVRESDSGQNAKDSSGHSDREISDRRGRNRQTVVRI